MQRIRGHGRCSAIPRTGRPPTASLVSCATRWLRLTAAFYWDLNDKTRAFSKRFSARFNGKMPTMAQAGVYSAALRYLQVVKETGTDKAETVMAKLKDGRWEDPQFGTSYIRADGRLGERDGLLAVG